VPPIIGSRDPMAKILVLGGGGPLGRTLAERAREGRIRVEPAFPGPIEVVSLSRGQLNVSSYADVDRALQGHRPEVVVYAAGLTDVNVCEWNKWEAYLINRDGADQAARSCARVGAAMVYFSTDLLFDGVRRLPYREEDPPSPVNIFADTKLAGELAVMTHLPRHLILRTGWLYGAHYRGFVSAVMERLRAEDFVFGGRQSLRQPTWCEDLLEAMEALLSRSQTGTFHVAPQGEASEFDVAKKLVSLLRPTATVEALEMSSARSLLSPYSVLDCSKAKQAGVAIPKWEDSLERYVRSLRGGDTKVTEPA